MGVNALQFSTGIANIALGDGAGGGVTTASNVICIGAFRENVDNHTYIGNINTTSVSGGNADFVTVDLTTGLLGHLSSSRRYKEDITPMDKASEMLFALKPVTYRYKKDVDRTRSLDYGLIAEDVAEIDPNLTMRGRDGQIESVRYNAINAMLLNEFLKEHKAFVEEQRKVQEQERTIAGLESCAAKQEATIAQQQTEMRTVMARLNEQASQIQKVSAPVEFSRSGTKVAGASQ